MPRSDLRHIVTCLLAAACVGTAGMGQSVAKAEPAWSVEGQWADACNCHAPCPCWKREVPNDGACGDLFYFHIEKGHYGDLNLDGLDIVQVFKTANGKSMAQSRKDKDVAIANTYLSQDLPPAQAAALEKIFTRLSPTQPPSAQVRATKMVKLKAAMGPGRVQIAIPKVLTVDLKVTKDRSGKPQPFPFAMTPIPWTVQPAVQAESVAYYFKDDGISWHIKHRHATLARFAYASDKGPLPWESGGQTPPASSNPRQ